MARMKLYILLMKITTLAIEQMSVYTHRHTNDLIKYCHAHNLHPYHGFKCFMDIMSTDRDQTHSHVKVD